MLIEGWQMLLCTVRGLPLFSLHLVSVYDIVSFKGLLMCFVTHSLHARCTGPSRPQDKDLCIVLISSMCMYIIH